MTRRLTIFLLAGEPSGDALGGRLMAALRDMYDGEIDFRGVGGPAMQGEGLKSLFPMGELSVMGVVEILPHVRKLFARMHETAAEIDALAPQAVITIDAPAFAHGVAKRIRNRGIPRIHYVAPQLWAWRPWRVHKFKRHFNHLLALLPFEPAWFARHGVPCDFVGHPVIEMETGGETGAEFRERNGIGAEIPVICVLLGSRRGEVTRLAAPFRETLTILKRAHPGLVAVLPTVPNVADMVRTETADWPVPVVVSDDPKQKSAAFAACNVGLAASGTATLELALAGVPFVVAYRVAQLTYLLARPLMRVRFANLINLILDREVIPELLQNNCRSVRLAAAVAPLFGAAGKRQVTETEAALAQLGKDGPPPSRRAAEAVLKIIRDADESGMSR
ncbi:MAG: lipid-A-disaccharide synthase [Proteobacteria bacterium]|nr:lipid-A-disaccharide synthase [Pseudomonadota bacterium]